MHKASRRKRNPTTCAQLHLETLRKFLSFACFEHGCNGVCIRHHAKARNPTTCMRMYEPTRCACLLVCLSKVGIRNANVYTNRLSNTLYTVKVAASSLPVHTTNTASTPRATTKAPCLPACNSLLTKTLHSACFIDARYPQAARVRLIRSMLLVR